LARDLLGGGDEERRPVALKLMWQHDSFSREVGMRVKYRLDTQYVLAVLRVHIDLDVQAELGQLD
jgi:hypothetical protein